MEVVKFMEIPYERQVNTLSSRMCGAAALCMVYRSLGLECTQEEVWPTIAPGGAERHGVRSLQNTCEVCARTHLLCADALRRGFAALTLQTRYALPLLRRALDDHVRIIANHRQSLNALGGHYSVVVEVDTEGVTIHDPWLGPARRFDEADWLKLWRPGWSNREVSGNLAVFIGAMSAARPARCRLCHAAAPLDVQCPKCQTSIPLQPSGLLGCINGNCAARMWDVLFCPWCDAALIHLT